MRTTYVVDALVSPSTPHPSRPPAIKVTSGSVTRRGLTGRKSRRARSIALAFVSCLLGGCTTLESREETRFHWDYNEVERRALDAAPAEVKARFEGVAKNKRMCDYGSWRKEHGFPTYEACTEHHADQIAAMLGIDESRYEQVDRRMAAREGAYAADRARRDRVAGDIARGLSSVAAEVSGAPVDIPTVTDDFFHRGAPQGGLTAAVPPQQPPAAVGPDTNSNHCLTRMSRGERSWYRNACPYTIDVRMCLATIYTHGTGCGQEPDYYTLPYRLPPGDAVLDDGAAVQAAVCRVIYPEEASFIESGFDGKGGFRCVAG